ncbi:MAG: hypothetical protein IJL74_00835 [Bacilli bacterium]|nr:hypothetical protein [Bacilli bacterium]
MKYSEYTVDQIMDYKNYQQVCNAFFNLASDEETMEKLKSILFYGGYGNYNISSDAVRKSNPSIERRKRMSMAYLIIRNPETFDFLAENNINLFHGTNANALPGIMQNGICSSEETKRNGDQVTTGEEWSRMAEDRDFVSLTDVLDIAIEYSSISSNNNDLNFPVIFGTTTEDVKTLNTPVIGTDIPEVGVDKKLPKEDIKVVLAPGDKIDIVEQYVDESIQILEMDDLNARFYYMDDTGTIELYPEEYNKLINTLANQTKSNTR